MPPFRCRTLFHVSLWLKIGAADPSKTLLTTSKTTHCHKPVDQTLIFTTTKTLKFRSATMSNSYSFFVSRQSNSSYRQEVVKSPFCKPIILQWVQLKYLLHFVCSKACQIKVITWKRPQWCAVNLNKYIYYFSNCHPLVFLVGSLFWLFL